MKELRYAAYIRKSTEDDERQVLSKEAQADKIKERFGDLKIVEWFDDSKSAFEPNKRVAFKQLVAALEAGKVDGVLAWHPDRLSRNAVDAGTICDLISRHKLKELHFASGMGFENTPEG